MNIPGLQEQVVLAPYTTFKVGGPAKFFVIAATKEELVHAVCEAQREGVEWRILGGGSDVLVSDAGVNGLVIKSELNSVDIDPGRAQVRAECGVKLGWLIALCAEQGLAGLEYATGVPATVGGAVWANLGAHGQEVAGVLMEVSVLGPDGKERRLNAEQCKFGYRDSIFKHEQYVILDALFQLEQKPADEIKAAISSYASKRKETQDLAAASAGCIFKNPTDQSEQSAGALIEEAGLKGMTMGGAQVSDIHANFIVNTGDATAEDIIMLISYIKQQVRDKLGVQLMEEVEYVGF